MSATTHIASNKTCNDEVSVRVAALNGLELKPLELKPHQLKPLEFISLEPLVQQIKPQINLSEIQPTQIKQTSLQDTGLQNTSLQNTGLQNKVVSADATLAMRHKISIDLHDSTIQPYIGLKLGLEALRRKIPAGAALAADVDELVMMAAESIAELRQYIGELKSKMNPLPKSQLGTSLKAATLELANKYQLRHHIKVAINIDTKQKLSEYLSAEIYQLVCEGLSNIHRHTPSKKAEINLFDQHDQLVIEVINYNDSDFVQFKPGSMAERITYLGGTISVNHTNEEALASKTPANKRLANKTLQYKTLQYKTIVTAKIPLNL